MKSKSKTNQPLAYSVGFTTHQMSRLIWGYRAELILFGIVFGLGWASTQAPWFVVTPVLIATISVLAKYRQKVFAYVVKPLSTARLRRQLTRAARDSGFENLRVGKVASTLPGELVSVRVPRGQTADKLDASARAIAGCLRVADVRVIHDRNDRSHADLSIIRRDPFQQMTDMAWPLLGAERTNVREPMPMGLDEYGRVVSARMLSRNMLVGGSPDSGKALALDTPIPTPSGWTTMGDLKEGDIVFDEKGKPCRVTDAWAVRYDRPCYEVEFSDKSVIVADAEHQWLTDTRASRVSAQRAAKRNATGQTYTSPFAWDQSHLRSRPSVVTTHEIRQTLHTGSEERLNHSINLAGPLECPSVDLPIPPYTLGIWLAEGHSAASTVTLNAQDAPEIQRMISDEGIEHHYPPRVVGAMNGSIAVTIDGLITKLKRLGLYRNKHVPTEYLRASRTQRAALLRGLVDGDGYATKQGGVEFSSMTERLALAVRELACSLGYKVTIREKIAKIDGRAIGPAWTVAFKPPEIVFGIARKAARQKIDNRANVGHRYITAIRPIFSVPVRCIAVDSPSHLFLAGETMIPTHNSSFLRMPAAYAACDPMARLFVMDGKRVEFEAWKPCATGFVSGRDLAGAVEMLTRLYEDVDKRYQQITAAGEVFVLDDMKIDFLMIDELPVYTRPAINADKNAAGHVKSIIGLLYGIIAQGRAAGVVTILSAQKPDANTVPTEIRDLIDNRFALHCNTRAMSDTILGSGSGEEGPANAADIPAGQPGVGYYVGDEGVRKTKAFFMTHKQALEISSRATSSQIDKEWLPV